LATTTRVMKDKETYLQIQPDLKHHEFKPGSIIHTKAVDLEQELYGVPEYLGALQSILLNEGATLFRRKYYENGSHAGFILYMTDAAFSQDYVKKLQEAMKQAKGPGNFRNMFMYAPNGKADGLKVIPISEVNAKDEFFNIKNITRDDVLSAHRVPPQMMGIIPNNTGGFGKVSEASVVFARNELKPLMDKISDQINDFLGVDVIEFEPYVIDVNSKDDNVSDL